MLIAGKGTDPMSLPEAGQGRRGEDGYLGYLLRQAAAAHRLRLDRALADLGVTPPQFAVLTMVKAYPGQSNADIARIALLTPQTTNVIIANLERAGHVERRPHEVHGRILRIDPTPSGQALLDACRSRVQAAEAEIARGFGAADIEVVRRWLTAAARPDAA